MSDNYIYVEDVPKDKVEKYKRKLYNKICLVTLGGAWVAMTTALNRTCDCMAHDSLAHMLVALIVCLMFRVGYLLATPKY